MSDVSQVAREKTSLLWIVLIDLVAVFLPWLILPVVSPALIFVAVIGPIFTPAQLIGIPLRSPSVLFHFAAVAVFLAYFATAVIVHIRFFRWLKYLVPTSLFIVSLVQVARIVGEAMAQL